MVQRINGSFVMKKYLESLLKKSEKPIGDVVCIGAGTGSELSLLSSLKPKRIVAVEASPKLFSSLNRKSKRLPNVMAINKWILPPGEGTAEAFLYNNPRYNSLSRSKNINLVHPNVKLEECVTVSGESMDSFIDTLKLDATNMNILIIFSPEAEGNLLHNIEGRYVQLFDILVLAKDVDKLYETSSLAKNQFFSYEKILTVDEEDCSFDYYFQSESIGKLILQLKTLETEKLDLQQKNNNFSEQVVQLANDNKTLESSLANVKREHTVVEQNLRDCSKRSEQLKLELESEKTKSKALRDEVEAKQLITDVLEKDADDQKKLIEQLTIESEKLNSEVSELQSKLDQLQQITEDKTSKLTELEQQITETRKTLGNEKSKIVELQEQLKDAVASEKRCIQENILLIEKNGYLNDQIKELRSQNTSTGKIADTNAKLLLKVQSDSEALRDLIVDKNNRIEELTSLIRRLHDKLSQASYAYAQLQQKHPELDWERI